MMSVRDLVKSAAEGALVQTGLARAARRRLRGKVLVLAYHNIIPTGEPHAGELSLHLPQHDFARQLDLIATTHDVVPLESILDDAGESARPRVAITFDDAYLGAVTAGVDELRRRSMPATIFIAPGLLGRDTWWDLLADASGGVMPEEVRRNAIEELRGDREAVLDWFASSGKKLADAARCPRIANESELARLSTEPGITFGSHTWSHRNLSALSRDELEEELVPSLKWLQERFRNTIPWLTFPYGLRSPTVEQMSEHSMYRGAFRVTGGWLTPGANNAHALPRLGVPAGISPHGFSLRLAGIASNR
jgi:peptidoglycan/xylan/chitin deacetylase (PgdA/CDA1 family)